MVDAGTHRNATQRSATQRSAVWLGWLPKCAEHAAPCTRLSAVRHAPSPPQSLEYTPGDLSPVLVPTGTDPAGGGSILVPQSPKPSIALATLEGHELSVWYTAYQEGAGI